MTLIAELDFEEGTGTNADDSVGAFDGTLVGTPSWATDDGDTGVVLNGTTQYVNLGGVFNYTTQAFSFRIRGKVDARAADQCLIFKGSFENAGYYLMLPTNGALVFITNQGAASQLSYTAVDLITAGVEFDVVITRSGAAVKIYLDGVDVTDVGGTHVNPVSSSDDFRLGVYIAAGPTNQSFVDGTLYHFAAWDAALTSGEVAALYAAPTPSITDGGTITDATHVLISFNPQGAACTANAGSITLGGNATYNASLAVSAFTCASGTTNPQPGTITLSHPLLPGLTLTWVGATGALTNANGNSGATGTLTAQNDLATPEDITAETDFTVTGAHSFTVAFDDTGTIVGPYLPIATAVLVVTGAGTSENDAENGDEVDYTIQIGETVLAVADTWIFNYSAPAVSASASGGNIPAWLVLGII
jgi:hypothetical protein